MIGGQPVGRPGGLTLALGIAVLSAGPPVRLSAQDTTAGKAVYVKWCAGCHGDAGAGDGPAARYMLPRPRDFTGAVYKIRSTASGQLPMDADLLRAVDQGLPGTAMPAWAKRLSDRERRDVVAYIKTFSAFFTDTSQHPKALVFSRPPGGGPEALKVGRQFFDSIGCRKCHGLQGRGNGTSAPTLHDDAGNPIFAADLTQNWRFRGGGEVEDIYHRLRTGLDGTPMPSFSDQIDQKFLTDEQLWHVAQYVRSLSPERVPEPEDVIHAARVAALPTAPGDPAWARAPRSWIPLSGQVIHKVRWFTPAVSGVWVQALHDGQALALRVSWDDRSRSPDSTWLPFTTKVLSAVASDDSTPSVAELWPDRLIVQFPAVMPTGLERPYFLMGSATQPVYQWRWSSTGPAGTVTVGLARGIERFDSLPSSAAGTSVRSQAVYDEGQWQVVFTRSLATADSSAQLQFPTARPIPVALFAADGSNGETGSRLGVSAWRFLALDVPVSSRVFVFPLVAAALTFGVGLSLVRRAQRST